MVGPGCRVGCVFGFSGELCDIMAVRGLVALGCD